MITERQNGFTLIESMMVIAIFSAVIFMTPPILLWLKHQGVRHAVLQLQADLQLARITAISQKQNCTIIFNTPFPNQYLNVQNNRICDLNSYRGNVRFLETGPDGQKMAKEVNYNRQGMNSTVVPVNIFLSDGDNTLIYRIRILLPGGISVYRWNGSQWW